MQDQSMQDTIKDAIASAQPQAQVTHSIPEGELPRRGDMLNIGGLIFEVQFVDYKREEIRIRRIKNTKIMGNGSIAKINKKDMR